MNQLIIQEINQRKRWSISGILSTCWKGNTWNKFVLASLLPPQTPH